MQDGKWIQGLAPPTLLVEAARRVLNLRLKSVHSSLAPALFDAAADIEHVHQLRVATRRARAALDIFAACLSESAYRAAKKELRRIRRAAGAARDWDVFLKNVTAARPRHHAKQALSRTFLTGYALAERHAAADQLAQLGPQFPAEFEAVQNATLAAVNPRSKQTLAPTAHALLKDLADQLATALAGNLDDYAHLHQVRITGKRLRYAMEIFAGCFPPEFRERLYPEVEEMQEILGHANDSHVAQQRLDEIRAALVYLPHTVADRVRPGIEALYDDHGKRLAKQRKLFDAWRQRWIKSDKINAYAAAGCIR